MVKTASTMRALGERAPNFSLPNVDGKTVSLKDFNGKPGLLVIFMCNHCPFVIHLRSALAAFGKLGKVYLHARGAACDSMSEK